MRDAAVAATVMTEQTMKLGAPEGAAGILMMEANLTPYVHTLVQLMGGQAQVGLPKVTINCAVKTGLAEQLVIEGRIPASQLAQLMRDSGLMQLLK
jgi:hypothetical protein